MREHFLHIAQRGHHSALMHEPEQKQTCQVKKNPHEAQSGITLGAKQTVTREQAYRYEQGQQKSGLLVAHQREHEQRHPEREQKEATRIVNELFVEFYRRAHPAIRLAKAERA